MANTDNRKTQRSPVTLRIKFKSANLEQFIERYAVDVSQGGIFIRTKEPLPVGTTMRFEFQLRDESPLITGEGTVVWIREPNAGQPGVAPGMGVRFDRLTESSQSVLDEILAHKAKRAATSAATQNTEPPTRVASAATLRKAVAASRDSGMQFAHDDEPADAFEQATKVHSLEELASLSARPDTGDPLAGAAEEYEEDKTKVYPAMAKPAARPDTRPGSRASARADARPTGPGVDLGLPGVTQPLPASPGLDSDVELGHASFEEEFDDLELPVDKDVELGMAGPTKPLQAERLARPDEVELGRAGTASPAKQPQPPARPTAPGKPIALGQSGAHDPMSDVPLPESGHFDLGMAGPTMPLPTERLGRGAEVELGAAGTTDEAEEAALLQAARAKSAAAERAAAAQASATRAAPPQAPNLAAPPAPPAPPAQLAQIARPVDPLEDSQEHLETAESALGALLAQNQPEVDEASEVDELAARRAARASEQMPAMAAPPDLDEGIEEEDEGIEEAVTTRPPVSADRRVVAASPAVRVSARTGTDVVEKKKGFPLLPLFAAAVMLAIIGGGAFLLATERGGEILAKLTGGTVEPPAEPGTVATPPPQQPVPAAVPPDAAAQAVAEPEPEIVMEEPEVPVELVDVQVRSTPPGATAALVEGDQSGPTPMTFKVDKATKHRVRISHPGFVSQEIEIDPAQPTPAPVTLAAMPLVLRTESTPPGATIYVNGRRVPGHAPNEFPLPPDLQKRKKLTVSFRIPGYDKLDIDIAPAFQPEGEAMVQTVQGTLVKSAPKAPATTPSQPPQQPASGDEVTLPPEEGAGQQGGGQTPPPPEPPKADTPPAAPPGQTP